MTFYKDLLGRTVETFAGGIELEHLQYSIRIYFESDEDSCLFWDTETHWKESYPDLAFELVKDVSIFFPEVVIVYEPYLNSGFSAEIRAYLSTMCNLVINEEP